MLKITGITFIAIKGSVMQGADCFHITMFSRNWLFSTRLQNHQNYVINASNIALYICLRDEIFLVSQIYSW